ncbi:MAG: hypothetical protein SGPRY_014334, partial [Prymnesium sp.]
DCDDGGLGADYSLCQLGTDCFDCGARLISPHPPPITPQGFPPHPDSESNPEGVAVIAPPTTSPGFSPNPDSGSNVGTVAGIAVAGALLVAVLADAARRRRRMKSDGVEVPDNRIPQSTVSVISHQHSEA